MDDKKDSGQQIDVNIGGSAAPAAATAAPPAPPAAEPEAAPAPTPPRPGSVVTSGDGTIGGPPTAATTVAGGRGGRGGKRWLKRLLALIVLAALVAGGWYIYQNYVKKQPAKQSAANNQDIQSLKVGVINADYGKLYPDMSVSEYGYLVNAQLFDGLVRYENKSKIVPDLASQWTNPDDKTWLFTIKDGVKFHDGHTLAASDVKYSLDKIIASNSDLAQTFASTIASVQVVGNNQVKITTKDPDPTLLNKLTFLYVIDANLPKGDEASQAGTGAYEIKPGTTPSSTDVQMVAFSDYHGGRPKVKSLTFGSKDSVDGLIQAYNQHQFNIVGPVPSADAAKVSGATQFITQEPDVFYIGLNTVSKGPLQNKQVRQAIRYALSGQSIGQAAGNSVTVHSQLIPPEVPGYNPAIKPYQQDAAKAKQLLKQAGYPNGLSLTLTTSSDNQTEINEIVSEFKAAGITVKVNNETDFDKFINDFSTGKTQMYAVDYASDTLDGLDIYTTTLPPANYSNAKLNDLLNQAATTTDPAKRLKLLQDAAVIIDQDVPVVPLSSNDNIWLMDKPYVIHQDMPTAFVSAYFYKVHLK